MLSQILLLKVSSTVLFNVSLKNEFTYVVLTPASEYLSWCCREVSPSHCAVQIILPIEACPDNVVIVNIGVCWQLIGIGRDALRLRHNVPSWGNVNPHHRGCGLHHHWLLHKWLLHHSLLLHHLLLHLHLRLLLRLLRSLIVCLNWLWSRFGTTHLCIY